MDKTLDITIHLVNVPRYLKIPCASMFRIGLIYGSKYESMNIYHPYTFRGHNRCADFKSIRRWLSK